jgi:hypothetical protein
MDPYGHYTMEGAPDPYYGGDFQSAAIYVGVMIVTAAVVLAILRKSGFRAMVAVGSRG